MNKNKTTECGSPWCDGKANLVDLTDDGCGTYRCCKCGEDTIAFPEDLNDE